MQYFISQTTNQNWILNYLDKNSSLTALSGVLYTDQFMCFLLIGIVLLLAMVGSITLTLEAKKREETISRQLSRQSVRSVFVISGNFNTPSLSKDPSSKKL